MLPSQPRQKFHKTDSISIEKSWVLWCTQGIPATVESWDRRIVVQAGIRNKALCPE
jgi:hypothetical protein